MSIAENIALIQERIATAARRAGRRPEDVALMAVSKTHPPERIREAYDAGLHLFGENRVQEFSAKAGALTDLAGAEWHMIGHLQTNKAGKAAELFSAVDSVDSVKLAERLDAAARVLNKNLRVLIEINVGGEAAKSGVAPDSRELEELLLAAQRFEALQFRGLMTVPPFADDPENARPYFRRLRELRDAIAARTLPAVETDVLSMGMSHDFGVAIEEGSTCVRVGTAIFGGQSDRVTKSEVRMDAIAAKEFVISKVVQEADLSHVPLSEIERKMLYFTEVHPSLPDILQVNAEFERDYDADEYERKIASLLTSARHASFSGPRAME